MKYELRVPTNEQYAYINCLFEGTHEDAVAEYNRLTKLIHGGFGLDDKAWNKALDGYLRDGSMSAEDHENMSKEQAWMIHEIDKSTSRLNYKNTKGDIHHSLLN